MMNYGLAIILKHILVCLLYCVGGCQKNLKPETVFIKYTTYCHIVSKCQELKKNLQN